MRLKLLRNLGTDLCRELGLEFFDKDKHPIYVEGSVREVRGKVNDQEVGDILIKKGLAEATTEAVTPEDAITPNQLRAVGKQSTVKGVTAPTSENFGQNPHDAPQKGK